MKNELITFTSPKSSVSEVFKTLRTNMQFINVSNKLKSVLITSTIPGEGKSWVSANLAVTFAQTGKKVILVDADMRKGRQHEIFELSNENGLSNYLVSAEIGNKINLDDYVKQTFVENLYVMTAGIVPPNPSELLTSSMMSDLIKLLEENADVVVFDGTPSTIVTDALILAKNIGTTLIVISHKQTKMEDLKQVKKAIENVGGKIAGVVVNKIPHSQKKYGEGYYYEKSITVTGKKNWFENIVEHMHKINKNKDENKKEVVKKETTQKDKEKKEVAKKETTKKDKDKKKLAKQDEEKKEVAKKETTKKDKDKKKVAKKETAKQDEAKKEVAKKETEKQDGAKKEVAKKETAKQDGAKKEVAKKETEKQDEAKKEAVKKETVKQDEAKKEVAKKETVNKDEEKKETAKKEVDQKEK